MIFPPRQRLPDATFAAIRDATPLPALVGRSVTLRKAGKAWMGLCPFHDDSTPSFAVYPTGYHCFACNAHGDAFDWLRHRQGVSFAEAANTLAVEAGLEPPFPNLGRVALPADLPPPVAQILEKPKSEADTSAEAFAIWDASVSPAGTLAEQYLTSRGLRLPEGDAIRFNQFGKRGCDLLPMMVALMVDPLTSEPRGIHRTYLKHDGSGKADGRARMMLGRAGVIKLHDPDERLAGLGIAEGIETALSVGQHVYPIDMWATASCGAMERLPVYPCVGTLHIFADRDPAEHGIKAARACASRWVKAGTDVRIIQPKAAGDWNDVAKEIAA